MTGRLFNQFANGLVYLSRRWGSQSWIVFLFILALVLATHLSIPPLANSQTSPMQIRGVWLTNVDSEVLFKKKL